MAEFYDFNALRVVPGGASTDWRSLLDPSPKAGPRATLFQIEALNNLLDKQFLPSDAERQSFLELLDGQERFECLPGHRLYDFDSEIQQIFIAEGGAFASISAVRTEHGDLPFPHFRMFTSSMIFGARPKFSASHRKVVETCICIRPGAVIRILNPWKTIDSLTLYKRVSNSLLLQQDSLIENSLLLSTNESRLHLLVKSLVNSKALIRTGDSKLTFKHSISQSMLSAFLGVSDNTLRPYLKSKHYEWERGGLLFDESFVDHCHLGAGLAI